jgi:hypothetical protein
MAIKRPSKKKVNTPSWMLGHLGKLSNENKMKIK